MLFDADLGTSLVMLWCRACEGEGVNSGSEVSGSCFGDGGIAKKRECSCSDCEVKSLFVVTFTFVE